MSFCFIKKFRNGRIPRLWGKGFAPSFALRTDGQALLEALVIVPCFIVLITLVVTGIRLVTTLYVQHQTHSYALCVLDGHSPGYCQMTNVKQVARWAPHVRNLQFYREQQASFLVVTARYMWSKALCLWGPLPEREQFQIKVTGRWSRT